MDLKNKVRKLNKLLKNCSLCPHKCDVDRYLRADGYGDMHYVSLKEKVSEEHKEFTRVLKTHCIDETVIFQSFEKIFILKNDSISILLPDKSFHLSFVVHNRFYVREKGKGLLKLDNDSLKLVPGGERFADLRIYAMLPFDEKKILVSTLSQGLSFYEPKYNRYSKPGLFNVSNKFFIENQLYHGITTNNGNFAFATQRGGTVLMNREGKIYYKVNKEIGLQDEMTFSSCRTIKIIFGWH